MAVVTLYNAHGDVILHGVPAVKTEVRRYGWKSRNHYWVGYVFKLPDDSAYWKEVHSTRRFRKFRAAEEACTRKAREILGLPTPRRRRQKTGTTDYVPETPADDNHAWKLLAQYSAEIDRLRAEIDEHRKGVEGARERLRALRCIRRDRGRNHEEYRSGRSSYAGRLWNQELRSWADLSFKMISPDRWVKLEERRKEWRDRYTARDKTIIGKLANLLCEPEPASPSHLEVKRDINRVIRATLEAIQSLQEELNRRVEDRKQCNYLLIRRKLSALERRQIWLRDKKRCYLCGEEIKHWNGEQMHIDHAQPFSKGGSNDVENLRSTHPHCNLRKSDSTLDDCPPPTPLSHFKQIRFEFDDDDGPE